MANQKNVTLELGSFYQPKYSYQLYRYVGMYGRKRVFLMYGYDCTDSTGTWFYRCYNRLACFECWFSNWEKVNIDTNGRFTILDDFKCELLHDINEFEVLK